MTMESDCPSKLLLLCLVVIATSSVEKNKMDTICKEKKLTWILPTQLINNHHHRKYVKSEEVYEINLQASAKVRY